MKQTTTIEGRGTFKLATGVRCEYSRRHLSSLRGWLWNTFGIAKKNRNRFGLFSCQPRWSDGCLAFCSGNQASHWSRQTHYRTEKGRHGSGSSAQLTRSKRMQINPAAKHRHGLGSNRAQKKSRTEANVDSNREGMSC